MAHEKLISELNSFINKNNLKKGKVEKDLGLPLNSLSNFLKLKKPLPDKWVQPIIKYCLGELSEKVTTANKTVFKEPYKDINSLSLETKTDLDLVKKASEIEPKKWYALEGMIPDSLIKKEVLNEVDSDVFDILALKRRIKELEWVSKIEAYCGELGILPADLIETHKQSLKMPNWESKKGKELKISDVGKDEISKKPNQSNFRAELVKNKTGYSK